jgi:hypothetical protein
MSGEAEQTLIKAVSYAMENTRYDFDTRTFGAVFDAVGNTPLWVMMLAYVDKVVTTWDDADHGDDEPDATWPQRPDWWGDVREYIDDNPRQNGWEFMSSYRWEPDAT